MSVSANHAQTMRFIKGEAQRQGKTFTKQELRARKKQEILADRERIGTLATTTAACVAGMVVAPVALGFLAFPAIVSGVFTLAHAGDATAFFKDPDAE